MLANEIDLATPEITGWVGGVPFSKIVFDAWGRASSVAQLTAEDIGLGLVNNTPDADKPVSTATQAALDALQADYDALLLDHTELQAAHDALVLLPRLWVQPDDPGPLAKETDVWIWATTQRRTGGVWVTVPTA